MSAAPALPVTFRPRKGRIVPYGFAVLVLVVCAGLAVALPGGTGRFALTDRLGVLGVGVVVAAFLCVLARPHLTVDEGGLQVVNLFFSRNLEWAEVVDVNLDRGDPWVLLDLADGDTLAVMAIQANDGEQARRAAQQLRDLVAAHSITDRND